MSKEGIQLVSFIEEMTGVGRQSIKINSSVEKKCY